MGCALLLLGFDLFGLSEPKGTTELECIWDDVVQEASNWKVLRVENIYTQPISALRF